MLWLATSKLLYATLLKAYGSLNIKKRGGFALEDYTAKGFKTINPNIRMFFNKMKKSKIWNNSK